MTIKRIPFLFGEYYHAYNRGNNKQQIFFNEEDYERFVKLLYLCNSKKKVSFREDIIEKKIDAWDYDRGEPIVSVGAWVLMPNHFHLYITPSPNPAGSGKDNIPLFIGRVCNAYTKYLNIKYKRSGSLFEGRFKVNHINNDIQAKYLFSYIHLNPVKLIQGNWKEIGIKDKNKTIDFLNNYKYSSYLDYLFGERIESKILDIKFFPNYFPTKEKFQKEIFEWLSYKSIT